MRCNRRLWFMKVTNFLLLTTVLTSLIVMITVMNRRPAFLLMRSVPYNLADLKSYMSGANRAPGAFLRDYKVNNESYCSFRYDLPARLVYGTQDLKHGPELQLESPYRVLYNVLEARKDHNNNNNSGAALTYATHVTPEFINFIAEIARHWEGAVSVAAFVPDDDADFITKRLLHVCQCLPEMSKVSVHYVFPTKHPPYIRSLDDYDSFSSTAKLFDTCMLEDTASLVTYRTLKRLSYPVNLARNVARKAAKTDFVMVSDIELIPSERLASGFNEMMMMNNQRSENSDDRKSKRVYVVPVFEIERYETIPKTKRQLLKLVRNERALYFHRHVCSHCQKFPGLENWLQKDFGDRVKPLMGTKREYPFHRWEPIFIGTNDEPLYSEVLSWEGKQDKMTQMLEMCLKGYRFVILDNAFLIHWPGVKRKTFEMKMQNKMRRPHILKNTRQYNAIINKLSIKYKKNSKCKLQ